LSIVPFTNVIFNYKYHLIINIKLLKYLQRIKKNTPNGINGVKIPSKRRGLKIVRSRGSGNP